MGRNYNEPWEQADITAFASGIKGDGVISGLSVTEKGTPDMGVAVAAGSCIIGSTTYTEGSAFNLSIDNGHATHDRKDLIIYDSSAGDPAVVKGTAATPPVPPAVPSGDILLAVVLVVAGESTSIVNADITEGRVVVRGNVNKHLYITDITESSGSLGYRGARLDQNIDEYVYYRWKLPKDFVSLTAFKVIGTAYANFSGNLVLDVRCMYGAIGQLYTNHNNNEYGILSTISNLNQYGITVAVSILSSVNSSDFIMTRVKRNADSALDTLPTDFYIQGIFIEYVST